MPAMDIKRFLVNEVVWRRRTGTNGFGESEYNETPIKVRWDQNRTLVRNEQGEEITSESEVLSLETVKTGDALRDSDGRSWPVIKAAVLQDIRGNYVGTSARL